jgi:hypothetical protein
MGQRGIGCLKRSECVIHIKTFAQSVIPAKAGIQCLSAGYLDSRFRDSLRTSAAHRYVERPLRDEKVFGKTDKNP